MASSSQITLSQPLPSDFEIFPTVTRLAFAPSKINQLMFPPGLDTSEISRIASKYQDRATNGCSKFVKAVSPDGEIIGISEWLYYTEEGGMSKKPSDVPQTWGPNARSELCDLFFGSLYNARIAAMEGKRCLGMSIYL
jgi:hypothetical protein